MRKRRCDCEVCSGCLKRKREYRYFLKNKEGHREVCNNYYRRKIGKNVRVSKEKIVSFEMLEFQEELELFRILGYSDGEWINLDMNDLFGEEITEEQLGVKEFNYEVL